MKKIVCVLAALSLLLAVGMTAVAENNGACPMNCGKANFVDANDDGVCDNRGQNRCGNFVDANGDGVCDNHGTCAQCPKNNADAVSAATTDTANHSNGHHGNGTGKHLCSSSCQGFVDADGDGVCDNQKVTTGRHSKHQNRGHHNNH